MGLQLHHGPHHTLAAAIGFQAVRPITYFNHLITWAPIHTKYHKHKDSRDLLIPQEYVQLNLEETWYSTELTCYQPRCYYKKVPLDLGNKHTSKTFSGTSDMDTGLASQVSTAIKSGVSLSDATVSLFIGLIYAIMEALSTVLHHVENQVFEVDQFVLEIDLSQMKYLTQMEEQLLDEVKFRTQAEE